MVTAHIKTKALYIYIYNFCIFVFFCLAPKRIQEATISVKQSHNPLLAHIYFFKIVDAPHADDIRIFRIGKLSLVYN